MSATETLVQVTGLKKRFGHIRALDGIDLTVARGEVVVFVGPSGCGKSTLLRCLNGLERATEGIIHVCGHALTSPHDGDLLRRKVGMVFQRFNLFPHLTALQNITLAPRHVLQEDRAEAEARARALLAKVGLADRADAYPHQLSGGQQQRVAIARALAMQPDLMLFEIGRAHV